jgi:hypothetical protein
VPVVTNTILDPAGQPIAGTIVRISLMSSLTKASPGWTSVGSIVSSWAETTDKHGVWSATLTANSLISPGNTYYTVSEDEYTTYIVVPDGGGPYHLGELVVTPPAFNPPGITGVQVAAGGTVAGVRPEVNFVAGENTTIVAMDNPDANRVDVTISTTGGGGDVTSVNSQTGAVVLAASDVGADVAGAATAALIAAEAYTDGAVATRAPNTRTITTTAPLTGGGDLSTNRTLAVSAATTGAVGVVQLAGDLGGTATSPTVPGLASKLTYRGAWTSVTAYAVDDLVTLAGTTLVCKTAHTSGSVFALTNWTGLNVPPERFPVAWYGAQGNGATDDTAAIQAAINAAVAYGTGQAASYAEVWFHQGVYLIGGAFQSTASGFAQLTLPIVAPANNKLTLALLGCADAASMPHWLQTVPQLNGVTLKSTQNAPDHSSSANEGSVIGGPTPGNGYGVGANFSNVNMVIKGIQIQVPQTIHGTDTWGADLRGFANCHVEDYAYFPAAPPGTITPGQPSGWACGLGLPTPGNNDLCIASNISIEGATYGLYAGEHVVCDRAAIIYCYTGLLSGGFFSSIGQQHGNWFGSLSIEACTNAFQGVNNTKVVIDQLMCEGSMQHVVATAGCSGQINLGGIIDTINVSDPCGIRVIYVDGTSGATSAPAVPATTAALRNPFWRDCLAVINANGSTITAIAIDGQALGITSGAVPWPSGRNIAITYTGGTPTWTVTKY